MALGIVALLMSAAISTRIWIAGRQFGGEHQFRMSFVIAILNFVGSSVISGILFYVSRMIVMRKHFGFCKVVSIFICFMFPLGTALGAYSLSVLGKNQADFEKESS